MAPILHKQNMDGIELLDPIDILDESDEKTYKLFMLAKACSDVLNYYQLNSPDAFGNAEYSRLDGYLNGFLAGREYELKKSEELWTITKGTKTILKIEVPQKTQVYYDSIKDIKNILSTWLG